MTYGYPAAARPTCSRSPERTNGACGVSSTTDRPNGAARMTVVINPAMAVVRIRIGRPVSRSQTRNRPSGPGRGSMGSGGASSPYPPAGHSARRIVMMATSGTRMPSCGLMTAAIIVKIAARSGRSRHSSRRPSSRNTTPNESTWPHTALSNQLTGLRTKNRAASSATDWRAPSSRAIDQAR